MRSSVVLPQPDGPSSVKNSPSLDRRVDTSSTARTVPKIATRRRSNASIAGRTQLVPAPSMSEALTRVSASSWITSLIFSSGLGALLRPAFLVVLDELDARTSGGMSPGSLARSRSWRAGRRKVALQDHLAHVLAVDVVDEDLGVLGVRAALDDGDAFHLRDGAVGRIDHLHRRAVAGPQRSRHIRARCRADTRRCRRPGRPATSG